MAAALVGHHRHDLLDRQPEREHRAHRLGQAEFRLACERIGFVVVMLGRRAGRRRHVGVVAVHVGPERVGYDAGVERLARQAIGEMAAVADVDLQPAVERGLDDLVHLALAVDEAAWMARERMRQDIARPQLGDDALQNRIGVFAVRSALGQAPELAEVDIERQVGLASRSRRTSAAP
jgi:hypothetical protein